MQAHFLNTSTVIAPGSERFKFLYVVVSAIAVAFVMTYSGIHGLAWWQSLLMLIASLALACGILFSVLEVQRLAQSAKVGAEGAPKEEVDPYSPRTVSVEPPTGEPYPHHEYYMESQGFDQGQLTSRLPDSTPIIDTFMRRKQKSE